MEKIDKPLSKPHPPVKLYKEEIERILSLLKNEGFNDLIIKTKDYKYTADEFLKLEHETIDTLNIGGYNPFYLSIDFDSSVRIYTGSDGAKEVGLAHKIEQLLKKNKRVLLSCIIRPWAPFLFSFLFVAIAISSLIFLYKISIINQSFFKNNLEIILPVVYLFTYVPIFLLTLKKPKNIIILDYKKSAPGFWERNKDRIMVGIIVGILTTIATATITLLITN